MNNSRLNEYLEMNAMCKALTKETRTLEMELRKELDEEIMDHFRKSGWDVSLTDFHQEIGDYSILSSFFRRFDYVLRKEDRIQGFVCCHTHRLLFSSTGNEFQRSVEIIMKQNGMSASLQNIHFYFCFAEVEDDNGISALFEYSESKYKELSEIPSPTTSNKYTGRECERIYQLRTLLPQKNDTIKVSSGVFSLLKLTKQIQQIDENLKEVKVVAERTEKKLDGLISELQSYKGLVGSQLELELSEEDEERIIKVFADECSKRVAENYQKERDSEVFKITSIGLEDTFGNTWDRLDEKSKMFLTSAKMMYNSFRLQDHVVDYSGVCLLVTKALELEMDKRFFDGYMDYLKETLGKNYSLYPTTMIKKHSNKKNPEESLVLKPLRNSDFTLGSVPYAVCCKFAEDLTDEEKEKNQKCILDYCQNRLYHGKDVETIKKELEYVGTNVDRIRKDYRNPSAHVDAMQITAAQECLDLVVYVQRVMKNILDGFME